MKMKRIFFILFTTLFIITNQASLAQQKKVLKGSSSDSNKVQFYNANKPVVKEKVTGILSKGCNYLPYMQVDGTRYTNVDIAKWAVGVNMFIPLWQTIPSHLIFTQLRFYDYTGEPLGGNIHLGYRYMLPDSSSLYGIYGAFDRKKSTLGNYYNQLAFGAELWYKNLFIGANFYQPVGIHSRKDSSVTIGIKELVPNNVFTVTKSTDYRTEGAANGGDIKIGYEFTEGVIGYIGGYYFKAKDLTTATGPRVELNYDCFLRRGKRTLGIFNKAGLALGIQHDKPRGTIGFLSINLRVGLLPRETLSLKGAARHMVDLVHRDSDVVIMKENTSKVDFNLDESGKEIAFVRPGIDFNKIEIDQNKYQLISLEQIKGNGYENYFRSGVGYPYLLPSLPSSSRAWLLQNFYNKKDWEGYKQYYDKLPPEEQKELSSEQKDPTILGLEQEREDLIAEKI